MTTLEQFLNEIERSHIKDVVCSIPITVQRDPDLYKVAKIIREMLVTLDLLVNSDNISDINIERDCFKTINKILNNEKGE